MNINTIKKYIVSTILIITGIIPINAQLTPNNPPVTIDIYWNASPSENITNYWIYYGDSTGYYTNKIAVGNVTTTTLTSPLIVRGATYYITATAQDINGLESEFSNELVIGVPGLPLPPEQLRDISYNPITQTISGWGVDDQLYNVERTSNFYDWTYIGNVISDNLGYFILQDPNVPENYAFYRAYTLTFNNKS